MPDQIPPLESAPLPLPVEESNQSTSPSAASLQLQESRAQLVRQFVQLLSQNQGQLPMAQEQKLQPLLRQLIPILTTTSPETPPPGTDPLPVEKGALTPLLQKVLQQLPAGDPLLKTLLATSQLKPATQPQTPLTQSQPSLPPLFEQAQTLLSSTTAASTPDTGRSLGLWMLQLLTLRSPSLSRESPLAQPELKNALRQQGIILPDQTILSDKPLQAKLLTLGRASIQFMAELVQTAVRATPAADQSSASTKPDVNATNMTAAPTDEANLPLNNTKAPSTTAPLLARVGERLSQLRESLFTTAPGDKHSETLKGTTTLGSPPLQPLITDEGVAVKGGARNGSKEELAPLTGKTGQVDGKPIEQITPLSGSATAGLHGLALPTAQSLPLNEFVQQLVQHQSRVPDPLRPLLQSLSAVLQQPLASEGDVQQWMAFLRSPLADNSVMGRSLRQWGATLLAIKFGQQGGLSAPQQQHLGQQLSANWLSMFGDEQQGTLDKLTGQFLGQLDRLQQQAGDPAQPLPNYVPLPTMHTERRESGMHQQGQHKEDGSYVWSLNFSLDLGLLGAVQIRVSLDLPDIQMQLTAEKMSTVDRIKETLPLLEQRFRELGLNPSTLGCRQGKVTLTPHSDVSPPDGGLSIHI